MKPTHRLKGVVQRSTPPPAILESLGTAVPGPAVPQERVREVAEQALATFAPELLEKMRVFETGGIRQRHFVRPVEWYLEPRGWEERSAAFADGGLALVEAAARDALARARLSPDAIDGVVLVSTTGIATPSLDARLIGRLGLRPDVERVPVWGLGCAGGVAGLNLAASLARANPEKRYLLVCVETCSLAFNLNDFSVRAFVATTLFSDGAAAAIVRGADVEGARLGAIERGASHTWPDSERVMGWDVLDEGLRVVFSRKIPGIIETQLAPIVERYLKRIDVRPARHVFHPGGAKVLDAYATALRQPPETFEVSRETLRDYGNMSSPTVLFVLDEALRRTPLREESPALLAALGPGFSAELGLVRA